MVSYISPISQYGNYVYPDGTIVNYLPKEPTKVDLITSIHQEARLMCQDQ
jgi:hypothetical protein